MFSCFTCFYILIYVLYVAHFIFCIFLLSAKALYKNKSALHYKAAILI